MALAFVENLYAYSSQQQQASFTFIDLFAGIGGFHTALHQLGGKCVYASEWDPHARTTYIENFKDISPELFTNDMFRGDITDDENQACIPENVDILCGGFPCQPFSQAGFKKGFAETRGTLFFEIAKIIKAKHPKAFFLENVRHLLNHDNGRTFEVIRHILEDELEYSVTFQVLKASDYGLPTHRPRLYIIGFRKDIVGCHSFKFPDPIPLEFTMSDVFEGNCPKEIGFTLRVGGRGSGIDDRRNWDTYEVDGEIRRITSKEGKKMMGFPEDFIFPVSEAQALKQLGNSVAVNPVRATAVNMLNTLKENLNEYNCK